jgi:carboxyl-terminal processing protease
VDAALGTAGLTVRVIDGQSVIWRVDSTSAAWRLGVAPGWAIERIDDYHVPSLRPGDTSAVRRLSHVSGVMQALRGSPGSRVRIVARDAAGVSHDVTVPREPLRGPVARFGNLPPLSAAVELTRATLPDGRCVGVIRYEYWMVPVMPALDRAVDSVRTCAGIVVDLRGNLGGVAGMMMGVAGHFLNEERALGIMRTRGDEMRFVANPRRSTDAGVSVEPFAGPLAILVDGLSASTSEMFAAGLQALGRARVFGERTAGQALPAMATRLPTGDILMHVVADFVAPDGTRIEGRGVAPEELVPLVRSDIVANRDAPLEAALRWIDRARPRSR